LIKLIKYYCLLSEKGFDVKHQSLFRVPRITFYAIINGKARRVAALAILGGEEILYEFRASFGSV
jgi:hypothetical protein